MKRDTRILFVYEPENKTAKGFVDSLERAMPTLDISLSQAVMPQLFFRLGKYDVAHFFVSGNFRLSRWVRNRKHPRILQTLLSVPANRAACRQAVFCKTPIVLSDDQKSLLEEHVRGASADVIPPYAPVPDLDLLAQPSVTRASCDVGDRLMVLAVNDVSNEQDFETLLYIMREFDDKRGNIRFVMPLFRNDANTTFWRKRVAGTVEQEKIENTLLLPDAPHIDSLLDSCDVAVYFHQGEAVESCFPQLALETLALGKPVLCPNQPPLAQLIGQINGSWVCKSNEDFVSVCRGLQKQSAGLEQIGTEVARFTRSRYDIEKIAALYRQFYDRMLP